MPSGWPACLLLSAIGRAPEFPISGHDVTALGIPPGPRVGELLDAVERWWEAGDFAADRDACLTHLKELARSSRSAIAGLALEGQPPYSVVEVLGDRIRLPFLGSDRHCSDLLSPLFFGFELL